MCPIRSSDWRHLANATEPSVCCGDDAALIDFCAGFTKVGAIRLTQNVDTAMTLTSFLSGRPFVKRFTLCYRTVVLSVCPVCDVGALWPNDWMDQDETWRAGRPRP